MKKKTTITDEKNLAEKEIQKIQDAQERQGLIWDADALMPQTTPDRQLEIHELRNETKFTFKELNAYLNDAAADYLPVFPNTNPFYKLMYKLNNWTHLDHNSFVKPPVVAIWTKQYIYGRFQAEMLPTLLSQINPLISGHIRKYKLFQFLNEEGRRLLEGFVKDATDLMEDPTITNWYAFELAYTKKYNLPVQLKFME